jgi:beta-N-acetylhexosaminidase
VKKLLFLLFLCIPLFAIELPPLDVQIGQMIMVGFRGSKIDDPAFESIRRIISNNEVGGLIFLDRNLTKKEKIKTFIQNIKALPKAYPLLLAVDQEGGYVNRLSWPKGYQHFFSPQHYAAALTTSNALKEFTLLAKTIKDAGFNLNFAPVVDIKHPKTNNLISKRKRSFSSNPDVVIRFAEQFLSAHNAMGVLPTLKHYPGHGSADRDSHYYFTNVTKTWNNLEFLPYQRLIRKNLVKAIMVGHIYNANVDLKFPATLSEKHINYYLRKKHHYDGLIITDDLQMGGVSQHYSLKTIVIQAIKAGNDILLFNNYFKLDNNLPKTIKDIALAAVASGELNATLINEAFLRIQKIKATL